MLFGTTPEENSSLAGDEFIIEAEGRATERDEGSITKGAPWM
jgi:hypothetical protein